MSLSSAPSNDKASDEKAGLAARSRGRMNKRKQHLVRVAMALIRERGFDSVSVNELAERASISVGGLYRYIRTKTDLLELICDETNQEIMESMAAAVASKSTHADKLAAAIEVYWNRVWEFSVAILVAYREYQHFPPAVRDRQKNEEIRIASYFAELVRNGIDAGEFREADEDMLSYQILLLSHLKVLKGWALRGRDKNAILRQNVELILMTLRK